VWSAAPRARGCAVPGSPPREWSQLSVRFSPEATRLRAVRILSRRSQLSQLRSSSFRPTRRDRRPHATRTAKPAPPGTVRPPLVRHPLRRRGDRFFGRPSGPLAGPRTHSHYPLAFPAASCLAPSIAHPQARPESPLRPVS
jgi:hypothetical protein